jgi:hypothetical protein
MKQLLMAALIVVWFGEAGVSQAGAQPATRLAAGVDAGVPLSALNRMPVKEVTVFKDGHAFVVHEGTMQTDQAGDVVMDYLPAPVMGTFWPYSAERNVRLAAVVSGKRRTIIQRTPLALRELLEANVGAEGTVTEVDGLKYPATILDVPQRSAEELEASNVPGAEPRLPEKGSLILLQTFEGVKAVPIERIEDFTFKERPREKFHTEEFRNLLTLKLEWGDRGHDESARVGLAYLQRGLRWVPGYRVAIDGEGKAAIRLQATLVNELADLEDVTVHLVVGVPSFAFKDTPDPISFQQVIAQVHAAAPRNAFHLSNAIMTQSQFADFRGSEFRGPQPAPLDLGPEAPEANRMEDLFVFAVPHVTLRKGERMVLPVAEYSVPYEDVFTLELPFAPPPELRANVSGDQQAELARLFHAPRVMHKIRLRNTGRQPFTTAPALIVRDDRVLGQGMMTYAAPGGSADIDVTRAVDVHGKKSDREVGRVPNAVQWQSHQYGRVDLEGTISLTSYRQDPVEVEVTRSTLGNVETADSGGVIEKINVFEEAGFMAAGYPDWWNRYNWPHWWHHFNGVSRVTWKLKLEPGEPVEVGYTWHYFWR